MKRPINLSPRTVERIHEVSLGLAASTLFTLILSMVAWALGYYPDFLEGPWFVCLAPAGLGVSALTDFMTRKEVKP